MKLDLEMVGFHDKLDMVSVDGKIAKFKKRDNGTRGAIIETNKPKVDVVIYKSHHYVGKNWFWWQLLYFFVSVFGIFDIKQDKKCLVVDCRFTVTISNDTKVTLKRMNYTEGGKFVEIQSSATVEETSNIHYIDKEAQQRHKKMKKVKTGIFFGLVVVSILLVILL